MAHDDLKEKTKRDFGDWLDTIRPTRTAPKVLSTAAATAAFREYSAAARLSGVNANSMVKRLLHHAKRHPQTLYKDAGGDWVIKLPMANRPAEPPAKLVVPVRPAGSSSSAGRGRLSHPFVADARTYALHAEKAEKYDQIQLTQQRAAAVIQKAQLRRSRRRAAESGGRPTYTERFKYMMCYAHNKMPSMRMRGFAQVLALLSFSMIMLLADKGKLDASGLVYEDVAFYSMSRSSVGRWHETFHHVQALQLEREIATAGSMVHFAGDAGDKAGKRMAMQFYWWDPVARNVVRRTVAAPLIGVGGGPAIALMVINQLLQLGSPFLLTQSSDSAGDMKSGLFGELSTPYPGLRFVPCFLHVLNLVLHGAYTKAYGEETAGEGSAFRMAYIAAYLMDKFAVEWAADCKLRGLARHIVAQASQRWWSLFQAIGDILRDALGIAAWAVAMSNSTEGSTYRHIFQELALWLKTPKIIVDAEFIFLFCQIFWAPAMDFLHKAAQYYDHVPEHERLGGYRAPEMPVQIVMWHRFLWTLTPRPTPGS